MQSLLLKALHRFTQLLRVHVNVPLYCGCIRMTGGLQPLAALCMDGCFADKDETALAVLARVASVAHRLERGDFAN